MVKWKQLNYWVCWLWMAHFPREQGSLLGPSACTQTAGWGGRKPGLSRHCIPAHEGHPINNGRWKEHSGRDGWHTGEFCSTISPMTPTSESQPLTPCGTQHHFPIPWAATVLSGALTRVPLLPPQAQARCHRIGQSKAVKVYRLITRNSYEREMFDKASLKLGLDKAVLQDINRKGSTNGVSMLGLLLGPERGPPPPPPPARSLCSYGCCKVPFH